ncbi:glycosyltransferase family 39 protein [Candidatus Woesebacteria bacterium]|nr:glycosyltransferase family 39 protein [Candidatus Woesebacteria bacterium]
MTKKFNQWLLPLFFVLLFILIRSIYFDNLFNFVYDQVSSSTEILKLWRTKSISLLGPPMSFTVEHRQVFFGGFSYLMQFVFLAIGSFDPFLSTYAFMVFSALMIFPLYFGTKRLINQTAAIIMATLYTLLPYFIESTSSMWNPYFMFSLFPLIVYLMGLFKTKKSPWLFLFLSILGGICFQLHYLFIFAWVGIGVYYFFVEKLSRKFLAIFILGFAIGIANLMLFEVRNNFYLLQTLWIYVTHPRNVSQHWIAPYYILSEVFFAILAGLSIFRKRLNNTMVVALFIVLLLMSIPYITTDARERSYPKDWYYEDDIEVYKIIKDNLPTYQDVNIFEFYDATGNVPKYFLKLDNVLLDYDDYYGNKYLYVSYKDDQFMKNAAYEVASFNPSRIVKTWKINDVYNLFLLERL